MKNRWPKPCGNVPLLCSCQFQVWQRGCGSSSHRGMDAIARAASVKETHLVDYDFEEKEVVVIWYCKDLKEIVFSKMYQSQIQNAVADLALLMVVLQPGLSWVPYLQDLKVASQVTGGTGRKSRWHSGPWELHFICQNAAVSYWS